MTEYAEDEVDRHVAIEIGLAVLNAQRTATEVVQEAQAEAAELILTARRQASISEERRSADLARLGRMSAALDRIEEELGANQLELRTFLDRFLASRQDR